MGPTHRIAALACVCATTFMMVLDMTVVAVALADVQRDLHAGLAGLQWVIDAYVVPLAALLPVAAALGDRFGRRAVFLGGTAVFGAASLACGCAPAVGWLAVARAVQGAGAAMMLGVALALIADVFPERRQQAVPGGVGGRPPTRDRAVPGGVGGRPPTRDRDVALGVFGATVASAIAIGPLLGGYLAQQAGWRAVFLINVPIGVAVLRAGWRRLPRPVERGGGPVDWAGTATLTAALVALVTGCVRAGEDGWDDPPVPVLLGAACVLLACFAVIERRVAVPVVDLRLFADRTYGANALVALLNQGAGVAAATYLALYAQQVRGLGPLRTGSCLLPFGVAAFLSALLSAPLLGRVPSRWAVGGTAAFTSAGLALLTALDAASGWTVVMCGLAVTGVGLGAGSTVLNQVAVHGVDARRAGMAGGVIMALRQVGTAFAVSALGAAYQHTAAVRAGRDLRGTAAADEAGRVAAAIADGEALDGTGLSPAAAAVLRHASVTGLDRLFTVAAAVTAAGGLVALLCVRDVRRPPRPEPRPAGRAADAR
ncbi:MFS transporter [Actinomadura graeca]|uniref:MFS transporter n=1 Tax=Actinomadura graeca TaxID=2750812 RepID=A0ABX8QV56_9ACTN|nr:MFS transporter [Actinomadura graeca]QXJ22256.1 MFS transporter [Actinomadura graeca]